MTGNTWLLCPVWRAKAGHPEGKKRWSEKKVEEIQCPAQVLGLCAAWQDRGPSGLSVVRFLSRSRPRLLWEVSAESATETRRGQRPPSGSGAGIPWSQHHETILDLGLAGVRFWIKLGMIWGWCRYESMGILKLRPAVLGKGLRIYRGSEWAQGLATLSEVPLLTVKRSQLHFSGFCGLSLGMHLFYSVLKLCAVFCPTSHVKKNSGLESSVLKAMWAAPTPALCLIAFRGSPNLRPLLVSLDRGSFYLGAASLGRRCKAHCSLWRKTEH